MAKGKAKGKTKGKKNKKKAQSVSTSAVNDVATTVADTEYYYGSTTFFRFPNGDTYMGEYCAHRAGLIWREGSGVYSTHDGHTYEGEWKEDRLVENKPVKVKYPNGSEYSGRLYKGKYYGSGTYTLPNGFVVSSGFADNKPVKDTIVIDVLDKLWCGHTKNNSDCTYLLPENEFYLNIDDNRGKGDLKVKPIKKPRLPPEEHTVIVDEEDEKTIFAKSTKTKDSLTLEDSLWYNRFKDFKEKHGAIKQKIKQFGQSSLDAGERKWWIKYQKYKKRRKGDKKRKQSRKVEATDIVKHLESRTVVVFYPEKQPEVETFVEAKQESLEVVQEEDECNKIQVLYESLKKEKEEAVARLRGKYLRQTNKAVFYNKKLDKTKNPDCICERRVCECVLPCNQEMK